MQQVSNKFSDVKLFYTNIVFPAFVVEYYKLPYGKDRFTILGQENLHCASTLLEDL
jgi:hypothetical protein